jgi:acyl-CoA thioesterase YciA
MVDSINRNRHPVRILTAMPTDTNPDGDIFGGWLMSHMDLAASALCKRRAGGRVVTVAVEGFKFLAPVKVGDEVVIYADLIKTGSSSMHCKVCTYAMAGCTGAETKVCEATYIFVYIDEEGRPKKLPALAE